MPSIAFSILGCPPEMSQTIIKPSAPLVVFENKFEQEGVETGRTSMHPEGCHVTLRTHFLWPWSNMTLVISSTSTILTTVSL